MVKLWTEGELRRRRPDRDVPQYHLPVLARAAHHLARHADARAGNLPGMPLAHKEALRVLLVVLFALFAAGRLLLRRLRLGLLRRRFRGWGLCARGRADRERTRHAERSVERHIGTGALDRVSRPYTACVTSNRRAAHTARAQARRQAAAQRPRAKPTHLGAGRSNRLRPAAARHEQQGR